MGCSNSKNAVVDSAQAGDGGKPVDNPVANGGGGSKEESGTAKEKKALKANESKQAQAATSKAAGKVGGDSRASTINPKRRVAVSSENEQSAQAQPSERAKNATREKSKDVRKMIRKAVEKNILFENLDAKQMEKVIDEMYREDVKDGESLIVQADPIGNEFYVVETGTFDIFVSDNPSGKKDAALQPGENRVKVASRGAGTCFGELALMYNAPRAATVTAVSKAVVWVVDRFSYKAIARNLGEQRLASYTDFLAKIDLLSSLTDAQRSAIAEALEEAAMEKGATVFQQGADGDEMYILLDGECEIHKDGKLVMQCSSGDYFGERALLKAEPRAATVTTKSVCKLLKLPKEAFNLLLGPVRFRYVCVYVSVFLRKKECSCVRTLFAMPFQCAHANHTILLLLRL
jgi:cAMP-dependent protein kinase regulator